MSVASASSRLSGTSNKSRPVSAANILAEADLAGLIGAFHPHATSGRPIQGVIEKAGSLTRARSAPDSSTGNGDGSQRCSSFNALIVAASLAGNSSHTASMLLETRSHCLPDHPFGVTIERVIVLDVRDVFSRAVPLACSARLIDLGARESGGSIEGRGKRRLRRNQ